LGEMIEEKKDVPDERILKEDRLRYSEEKFRSFVEQSSDGIVVIDERGSIAEWSHGQEKLTGLSRADALGRPIWDIQMLLFPEERKTPRTYEEIESATLAVLRTGQSSLSDKQNEVEIQKVDGTRTIIQTTVFPIKTSSGWMVGVISRDITERRQAQEALQESNRFNKEIVSGASEGVVVYDRELNYLVWNHFMERLTGMPAQEVLGRNALELFPHLREQGIDLLLKRAIAGETVNSPDTPFHVPGTGRSGWVSGTYGPHRDAEGNIVGVVGFVRDITERKRMEDEFRRLSEHLEEVVFERTEKLAESERRFRELADLLPQIVFEIDENGDLRFMNRAAFAATGCTEEDLRRGLNAFRMFAQEDHDRAMRGIRRTMAGETIGGREFTALRRDGTTFPVLVYTAPIMREGKTAGLRGIAIDITELKRTEQKLRDSEERFRGIAERSIDGIFELDLEGRVTYVSPSVERALGYKPEEVIGTRMERYLAESEFPKIAPNMAALMKGMNVLGLQGEMLAKDGTHVPAELNASPIFKDGSIVGVQGIVRDITERRKMENALRESEERYRRLMKSMSEHIAVLDSEWRYLLANEALTRSVKIQTEQLLGKKLTEVFPGIEKSAFFEAGERVMKYRRPATVTSEYVFEDGRRGWFESHIYPVPEGIMYVANDVTDRKRMEEELTKSQRLAAIGETAAIVGHDLRNPLQGIASTVYLAKKILKSPKAEKRKEAA
jgi:PAS domain S-box-containing protein